MAKSNSGAQSSEISTIDDLIKTSLGSDEELEDIVEEPKAAETPDGDDEPGTQEGAQAEEDGEPEETPSEEPAEDLRAQLKAQEEIISQMRRQQQTPTEKPKEEKPGEEPDFSFNIPGELVKLMESEDPGERQQGMALFAQGIARAAYNTAAQRIQALQQQQIPNMITQMLTLHDQARAVAEDFYGSNPDLNRAELRPFIRETARVVAEETGAQSWTPELKRKVEQRVRQTLGLKKPTAPKPKPPSPTPKGGGGKRPDVGSGEANDVISTIL